MSCLLMSIFAASSKTRLSPRPLLASRPCYNCGTHFLARGGVICYRPGEKTRSIRYLRTKVSKLEKEKKGRSESWVIPVYLSPRLSCLSLRQTSISHQPRPIIANSGLSRILPACRIVIFRSRAFFNRHRRVDPFVTLMIAYPVLLRAFRQCDPPDAQVGYLDVFRCLF
jgi:hypothetical protein